MQYQFKILKSDKSMPQIAYESKKYKSKKQMEEDSVKISNEFTDEFFCIQFMTENTPDLKLANWIANQKRKEPLQRVTDNMAKYEQQAECEVFVC